MKIEHLVEKKLREKAPAASTEQPEKKVKQNWNSVDLSRALLKFRLSAAALKVALCVHSHQGFCKTGWNGHYVFHEKHMQEETGFVKDGEEKKIRQGLKDLVSVNAIEEPERIKVKGKWRGKVIKWNFDYSSWGRKNEPEEILPEEILPEEILPEEILPEEILPEEILPVENPPVENPPVENPPVEKPPVENPPVENHPVIRIIHNRKDYTDPEDYTESPKDCTGFKDCTRGEDCTEGAAAKPQPAPPPEKAASQESSFPETAQGQQNGNKYQIPLTVPEVMEQGPRDLWGVPERVPEKPKKGSKGKSKGKPKAAEEIEIPTLEQVTEYITGYITENNAIEFWTVYEIQLTAKAILEYHINTGHWKDWQQGARNWIRRSKQGAFRPEVVDPARFDKGNQPGRARGQVTTAARIMEMAGNIDPQRALEQRREQEIQKGGVIIQN